MGFLEAQGGPLFRGCVSTCGAVSDGPGGEFLGLFLMGVADGVD